MNAQISARILALTAQGVDVRTACEQILGKANMDAMISDLYDALRAKAAA